MNKEAVKIVYEDDGINKVVRGYILREDDFTYQVEIIDSHDKVVIGKRAIVKIMSIEIGGAK